MGRLATMVALLVVSGRLAAVPLDSGDSAVVPTLTREQASSFARLALKGIQQPFPNKPADVWNSEADARPPRALHPAFFGSFDWHSSVHGHWMLVRLLRTYPDLPEAAEIRRVLNLHLTRENLAQEAASFQRANAQSFERPYGWSWCLKLVEELHGWEDEDGRKWASNIKQLEDVLVRRYLTYFPKQTYPIRSGVHSNTAFGLAFALDYARTTGRPDLERLLIERGKAYYGRDENIPARWEPDGADFFSPSLTEADLMRRILPAREFRAWLTGFLPELSRGEPKSVLNPPHVSDRSDPQIVHLDGLSLSRAWCMQAIAESLPAGDPAGKILAASAARHARAGLSHVSSGDYAGEHWLASFAIYLTTKRKGPTDR
jgi:hypothetical protein